MNKSKKRKQDQDNFSKKIKAGKLPKPESNVAANLNVDSI